MFRRGRFKADRNNGPSGVTGLIFANSATLSAAVATTPLRSSSTRMGTRRWGAGGSGVGGGAPVARGFTRPVNAVAGNASARDPDLSLMEKQFLLACERGDLASVKHYLACAGINQAFNVNCVDPLGRTALLIAIENENVEMIETLLESNVETGDAILYAINEENVEAVEIILNHLERMDRFTAEVSVAFLFTWLVLLNGEH